jgi:hypothetical protein
MFGLAALAALMAMASVGISSAMAESTTLCSGDGSGCGLTHVHETTLTGAKAEILTSVVTVKCDVLLLGDTIASLGSPLEIEGNFTYTNCGNCTVTEENGPARVVLLRLGHETAHVGLIFLIHVDCPGLNCRYKGELLLGTAKGPLLSTETNGSVTLLQQTMAKEGGLFCPSTANLDITTTPLSATYIGS